MAGRRLEAPAGAWIDRSRSVGFSFNGRPLTGFRGDTLASALLANGVRLVGRSFKMHRPRGIFSCGIEEPCAVVDLGRGARRTPNVRATLLPLVEGLEAVSVNCWPSVGLDLGALTGAFAGFLPAGFYYKTFMWPSWHVFEPAIRRMAGLGQAPRLPDPDHYEEKAADADVLVVGSGIAGLAAAVAAAHAGARTMLLAGSARLGGALGARADYEVGELAATARQLCVDVRLRTLAFGVYDHNLVCAVESLSSEGAADLPECVLRERLWKIRARAVIAAAGAFERPLLFPNSDRPGVMLAGAAVKYAFGFGVACGERAVIAANGDSAYEVAGLLAALGIEIAAIVDRREGAAPIAGAAGLRVMTGAALRAVHGARSVRGCTVASLEGGRGERIHCDLVLSAGGYAPAVHLHSQGGGKLRWVPESAMFVPDGTAPGLASVGACAGVFTRGAALSHAAEVGAALAQGRTAPAAPVGGAGRSGSVPLSRSGRGKQFVDVQNDVTAADVALAARENYRSVEHLKRYTTTGMGTDQGKTSNINALILMGGYTGQDPPEVGTTRFRPPFAPVTLGAIAGRRVGRLYRPLKRLPAHDWHVARGALFETFGDWEWLAKVGFDAALAPAAMAHMTMRETQWESAPVRVLRASFSGELGYEVNLPVDLAEGLFERLWSHAEELGAVLYGIEALEVMRVEKGYIHIGTDTDGTTLPGDVGFARGIERKAAPFVGRRSLLRPAARDPGRLQLVGLVPVDGQTLLPVGGQIAPEPPPTLTEGHVTSSHLSPELGMPIALAMLKGGSQRTGEEVRVHHLGTSIAARVTQLPFVDPSGARVHG